MAQSTSNGVRKNTWRAILIGAAVPFAVLAAAPAVGAAAPADQVETVNSEQLPPLPGAGDLPVPGDLPIPDPTALTDLATCLTDLQAALDAGAPIPAESLDEYEQLPPLPLPVPGGGDAPALPDIGALAQTCQDILATVTGAAPDLPVDPPVDVPAIPKD
ncbi:MAG: hypothetical protein HOQ43_04770 [Glycomyces artemisiae]|uniref:Secreted protein n=1 Tax=Glycomyces artemisiae TaxID=1076443 RepID=A0A850C0Y6_9ACTN|nr:hypothetical protein [Glycomyces artemisiae]